MKLEEIEIKNGKYYPKSFDELKFLVDFDNYSIKLSNIDISNPNIDTLVYLFCNTERKDFSGIGDWDTTNITSLRHCFYGATYFNENINNWNTSNCKSFIECFARCINFNQPLNNWDVSNAKSLYFMFYRCFEFNQDISNWNVSNINSFQGMFRNAKNFNQNISNWNVSNGENFEEMLAGAENFNQDISNWNMKNAKTIEKILYKAKAFSYDISSWDISSVCNTDDALKQAGTLEKIDERINTTTQSRNTIFHIKKINKEHIEKLNLNFVKLEDEFKSISWFASGVNDEFYVSVNKHEKGYNYIVCRLFNDVYYLIDNLANDIKNRAYSDLFLYNKTSQDFKVYLARDLDDIEEEWIKKDKDNINYLKYQDTEILFDSKGILIQNQSFFNINTAYAIMFEYILACAYKNIIFNLNSKARAGYKNDDNKTIKDKKKLKSVNDEICMFDLHHYYNIPIDQYKCSELLIKVYKRISDFYYVKEIHDDLKETINQVAFLVNDDSKYKTGLIFSVTALAVSLLGTILSLIK